MHGVEVFVAYGSYDNQKFTGQHWESEKLFLEDKGDQLVDHMATVLSQISGESQIPAPSTPVRGSQYSATIRSPLPPVSSQYPPSPSPMRLGTARSRTFIDGPMVYNATAPPAAKAIHSHPQASGSNAQLIVDFLLSSGLPGHIVATILAAYGKRDRGEVLKIAEDHLNGTQLEILRACIDN